MVSSRDLKDFFSKLGHNFFVIVKEFKHTISIKNTCRNKVKRSRDEIDIFILGLLV